MAGKIFARTAIAALAVLIGSMVFSSSNASAQYPGVAASITITTNIFVTPVGSTIVWTGTLTGLDGNGLADLLYRATVTEEPPPGEVTIGSKTVVKITDEDGAVSGPLFVGNTPGVIIITGTHGDLQAQTKVIVTPLPVIPSFPPYSPPSNPGTLAGLFAPQPRPSAPAATTAPAAVAPGIRPPSTGDAGLVAGTSERSLMLLLAAAAMASGALGLAGVQLSRKR
jgi:hypothetical protein